LLWRGAPYRCLVAIRAGLAELVVSPPALEELRSVLVAKFEHTEAEAEDAVSLIQTWATSVEINGTLHVMQDDPDDDKFLETAQVGGASYVVSGDRHLLALGSYGGISVIRARAFLDLLRGVA
jgi:uncharacterized protein